MASHHVRMSNIQAGETRRVEGWLGHSLLRVIRYPHMMAQGYKRVKMEAVRPLKGLLQGSKLTWHCFRRIFLAKAGDKASPHSRRGEMTLPLDWRHGMYMHKGEGLLGLSLQIIYHTPFSAHPVDSIVCLLV